MYINKHGITYRRFFICLNCKCEFSADDRECFICHDDSGEGPEWIINCECPDCGYDNTWNPNDILRATIKTEEKDDNA